MKIKDGKATFGNKDIHQLSVTASPRIIKHILTILWHKRCITCTEYNVISKAVDSMYERLTAHKDQFLLAIYKTDPLQPILKTKHLTEPRYIEHSTANAILVCSNNNPDDIIINLPSTIVAEQFIKHIARDEICKAGRLLKQETGEDY